MSSSKMRKNAIHFKNGKLKGQGGHVSVLTATHTPRMGRKDNKNVSQPLRTAPALTFKEDEVMSESKRKSLSPSGGVSVQSLRHPCEGPPGLVPSQGSRDAGTFLW